MIYSEVVLYYGICDNCRLYISRFVIAHLFSNRMQLFKYRIDTYLNICEFKSLVESILLKTTHFQQEYRRVFDSTRLLPSDNLPRTICK